MFDRHQAEINVMHLVPFFSAKSSYAISSHNCHRNVSLPSGASLWNGIFGRVEGQYTTVAIYCTSRKMPDGGGGMATIDVSFTYDPFKTYGSLNERTI